MVECLDANYGGGVRRKIELSLGGGGGQMIPVYNELIFPVLIKVSTFVTNLVTFHYLCMRVIAVRTLKMHWVAYPQAEQALLAWYEEAEAAQWNNPNELKQQYRSASILTDKRVVFNIHGNAYRLIVDIEYRLKIVFVVWFGTHRQYDKLDAKKVSYVKANKK